MNVLVACEESQRVCTAFRERGHNAFSCDILPCSGGHPEWHIQGDALAILTGGEITTMDGIVHNIQQFDMLIAHPPCTYLSNVHTKGFSLRVTPPEKVVQRWIERAKAAVFFMQFMGADIPKICVENPVGFMNTAYRKPDMIIHPYMFAENENDNENYVTKATCLWTKGLPVLKTNNLTKPDNAAMYGRFPSGKAKTWEDQVTKNRACVRSKTFPGIARAMAEQWG